MLKNAADHKYVGLKLVRFKFYTKYVRTASKKTVTNSKKQTDK